MALSTLGGIGSTSLGNIQRFAESEPLLETVRRKRMEREEQDRKGRATDADVRYKEALIAAQQEKARADATANELKRLRHEMFKQYAPQGLGGIGQGQGQGQDPSYTGFSDQYYAATGDVEGAKEFLNLGATRQSNIGQASTRTRTNNKDTAWAVIRAADKKYPEDKIKEVFGINVDEAEMILGEDLTKEHWKRQAASLAEQRIRTRPDKSTPKLPDISDIAETDTDIRTWLTSKLMENKGVPTIPLDPSKPQGPQTLDIDHIDSRTLEDAMADFASVVEYKKNTSAGISKGENVLTSAWREFNEDYALIEVDDWGANTRYFIPNYFVEIYTQSYPQADEEDIVNAYYNERGWGKP